MGLNKKIKLTLILSRPHQCAHADVAQQCSHGPSYSTHPYDRPYLAMNPQTVMPSVQPHNAMQGQQYVHLPTFVRPHNFGQQVPVTYRKLHHCLGAPFSFPC